MRALVLAAPALALGGCGVGLIGVAVGAALGGGGGGGGSPGTSTTVPGSPGLLSFDTFESPALAAWQRFGSALPSTTTGGNPGSALLPGGSATTNGEAVTLDVFRVAPGLAITADLQVGALSTANATIWLGLRSNTSADGIPSLDAGVLLVSATGQRQFFLNGAAVFGDALPDTSWHNFQIVIRTDCRVEFYVDGVLVHATTGQLQSGGLWRPVTIGGRSVGATTLSDNLFVTGTPPTARIGFADGLAGTLTGVYTLGSTGGPQPSIDSFLQGVPAPSLDPGGSGLGTGEAQTVQRFDLGNGPLELRAALRVPALTTANAQVWFGLDRGSVSSTADGVRDLLAGVHLQSETVDVIEYVWYDGATQTVTENLDTNWHVFQVIVRPDRFVEFFRDGLLVFTSTSALPAGLGLLPVSVGGRSSGASARADNLAVISPGFGHAVTSQQLTPSGTAPAARSGHRAIHDPVADAMIVFGGFDGTGLRNDLWCLRFGGQTGSGTWILLTPTGTAPSARERHGQVWDANRQRMLVFGGFNGTSTLADVHAVNLGGPGALAWTALTPGGTGPTGLSDAAVVFDATNDRLVAFGGFNGTSRQSTVWSLQFSSTSANGVWSTVTTSGTPPSARDRCAGLYDGESQRMLVVFGDDGTIPNPAGGQVQTLSLVPGAETWTLLSPVGSPLAPLAGPGLRRDTASAGWTAERRAFVFGGYDPASATILPPAGTPNEVWGLDLACGSATPNAYFAGGPGSSWPPARTLHAMIWHPAGRRLIVFGGETATPSYLNDAWELKLP